MPRVRLLKPPETTHDGIRNVLAGTDPRPPPTTPTIPTTVSLTVLTAYRHLLRTSLQAVRFSSPARYSIRNILRDSFRNSPVAAFNPRRIDNTLHFLEQAREHNGFEHKILRNILHVRYWREHWKREKVPQILKQNNEIGLDLRKTIPAHFDATLTIFNESMDLCLRI